ncbi:MAG: PHP domain-containing protein [Candidatus Woesearchaeota archaeon]
MNNEKTTIKMDTHMHSKASDGLWSPSEVVAYAKSQGLTAIALTDHDTVYGVPEAVEAGKVQGIRVIPGIEIDAQYESNGTKVKDIELLGLHIDVAGMLPFTHQRAVARMGSLDAYVHAYNNYVHGATFDEENSQKQFSLENPKELSLEQIVSWKNSKDNYENPAPFLSKMDVICYLVENHVPESEQKTLALSGDRATLQLMKDEYAFLFTGKEVKPTFYDAIKAVKAAGGLAVVAHPGLSKGYKHGMLKEWELSKEEWFKDHGQLTPFQFLADLKAHGLDGVELYNYKGQDKPHAAAQELINEYFAAVAEQLHLITTYGSDCHGPKNGGPFIGKFGSDHEYM